MEEGLVQTLLSAGTAVALLGYIGHSIWSGYGEFKKDIYEKMNKKLDTERCIEYRGLEKTYVEEINDHVKEIDADLQRHKEVTK